MKVRVCRSEGAATLEGRIFVGKRAVKHQSCPLTLQSLSWVLLPVLRPVSGPSTQGQQDEDNSSRPHVAWRDPERAAPRTRQAAELSPLSLPSPHSRFGMTPISKLSWSVRAPKRPRAARCGSEERASREAARPRAVLCWVLELS